MNDDHAHRIVQEIIAPLPPIEVWNRAMEFAIEIVREVLREEDSSLTDDAAGELQQRLHQQLLHEFSGVVE